MLVSARRRAAGSLEMPDVNENLAIWSTDWDWSTQGDEWSEWWGGTRAMWYGAVLPRIHAFLPAGTVLEIAPGYGRWTEFLKAECERLILVDLTERCIDHCRERFADSANIEYHVNDGRSLEMVEDGSVDFVFSFDSLVHVEADVMDSYLRELSRKLSLDGIGFIHHSNMGKYRRLAELARRVPAGRLQALVRRGAVVNLPAWRAESMTAELFAEQCTAAGLSCIGQELINWEHGPYLIDCLSQFTRPGSRWDRGKAQRIANRGFVDQARRTKSLYSAALRRATGN
jgi:2-polyprenyl-3-methyl-5-hydroxy-6-metoxy-1,4-benzoquinol methylase